MDKDKDSEKDESVTARLETITNQDQSVFVTDASPNKNSGKDKTNMSAKTKPKRSCLSSISSARKTELLTKKLDAEKAALQLTMMEEEDAQCREEEMEFLKLRERQRMQKEEQLRLDEELARARVNAERRQKIREMRQRARLQQLEYEHTLNEVECIENEENKSMREGLAELLGCETLEDHIKRLGDVDPGEDNLANNSQCFQERENVLLRKREENLGDQGDVNDGERVVNRNVAGNKYRKEPTIERTEQRESQPNIREQTSSTERLLEKMLPALIKMDKPKLPVFDGNPVEYARFKASIKVEIEKKGVYDKVEKLKFLLDSVEGPAKSCLKKFIPGSEKYQEAWIALDNRFGQPDVVVAAAKKRVEEFSNIPKENAEKIREYQKLVSELVGIYGELNFEHELKAQISESCVKRLTTRLCVRWGERVKGKLDMSILEEFAKWLEKESKLCERKQRWIPGKRDWKKSQSITDGLKGMKGNEILKSGVFTGTDQGLSSSRGIPTTKCPVHEMGKHTLQECRKFVDMPVDEKEKIVLKNRLCLSCLSSGHRLNQCVKRIRCQVKNC